MSDVHRPYVVFGNVDETLITVNSMFDFPHYQLVRRPGTAGEVPGQASRTRSGSAVRSPARRRAAAVRRQQAARPDVDPRGCYSYGDHLSDLSMLELVGRPVAVWGDGELREHLPAQAASVRI
ncbi:hypothetical protein [Streptomyces sp. NPDC088719]|uniref:hypothetical protein n=1 Tax=Streptomyces sp. NPDC088719 TaxID=3365872 RepID=UPI00380DB6EB